MSELSNNRSALSIIGAILGAFAVVAVGLLVHVLLPSSPPTTGTKVPVDRVDAFNTCMSNVNVMLVAKRDSSRITFTEWEVPLNVGPPGAFEQTTGVGTVTRALPTGIQWRGDNPNMIFCWITGGEGDVFSWSDHGTYQPRVDHWSKIEIYGYDPRRPPSAAVHLRADPAGNVYLPGSDLYRNE